MKWFSSHSEAAVSMRRWFDLRNFISTSSSPYSSTSWRSRFCIVSRSNPCFSSARTYTNSATSGKEEEEKISSPSEGPGISYGLNLSLSGRGIIVKEKAFHNLNPSELRQKGAILADSLSNLPVLIRGNVIGGNSLISKAQFTDLLKQVTSHISSVSSIFVQDGAVGSSPKFDAKVRVISDNPSAALTLSSVLWRTTTRAISHDSCPVTIYVSSSIGSGAGEFLSLGSHANNGFIVADIDRNSLVLSGRSFADANGVKKALSTVAAPIICARRGLPLSARFFLSGKSLMLILAPEDTIVTCSDLRNLLITKDGGVVLCPHGVSPFFRNKSYDTQNLFKNPSSLILTTLDSSGSLPLVSKLCPDQAAYHFLAGYQNGNFFPAYMEEPFPVDPIQLAKVLHFLLEDNQIPCFLINPMQGGKHATSKEMIELINSTLTKDIPFFESRAGDLKGKYRRFLSDKFPGMPEHFAF